MLYVFQVDTGTMLTFEMNVALDSVSTLQNLIHSNHNIPSSSQVLLVSGGLCLSPSARVCSYPTAGTDTNPIFLFNRVNIESDIPRTLAWTPGHEFEIPTGHTLAATLQLREKLGVEIFEVSKEIFAKSQVLIHDQHLQHLGWGAVVCNLEDIVGVFGGRIRGDVRVEELDLDVVEGLPTTITDLGKIPLPPSLLKGLQCPPQKTLLSFLTQQSPTLLLLPQHYQQTSSLLDMGTLEALRKDALQTLKNASQPQMKEIKGLSDRLYRLDEMLETCRKVLKEQQELSSSLTNTTSRYLLLSDPSILPDLTLSHSNQLQVMIDNAAKLSDIQRRCLKAKEELVNNLNSRLKWVTHVQKNIHDLNAKISVYMETHKKFETLKNVISQVVSTEKTYKDCIRESVRRKKFETNYNHEVTLVTKKFTKLFQEETGRREKFRAKNDKHFIYNTLFEGLDAMPTGVFEEIQSEVSLDEDEIEGVDLEEDKKEVEEEDDVDVEEKEVESEIERLKREHAEEIEEIVRRYEEETENLRREGRSEVEAVKSRVKFVSAVHREREQKEKEEDRDKEEDRRGTEVAPQPVQRLSNKLNLTMTCKIGEPVLLYHSAKYESFIVHSNALHFLHTDCADSLSKECIYLGTLVDKEYCVARRPQNRYKVPQGFHFYRVKVVTTETFVLSDFS